MLEKLRNVQNAHNIFTQRNLIQMVELFKGFNTNEPIKDNMMNIEYGMIVPEIRKNSEIDGLFYGSMACFGEDRYSDCLHDYTRLSYDDKIVHVMDFNKEYDVFTCSTIDLPDGSGLICLALQELSPYKDFMFMHELGHLVKILNGFPMSEVRKLEGLEETIAHSLAIKALALCKGLPEETIIKDCFNPALNASFAKESELDGFDVDLANKYYGNMKDDVKIVLDFISDSISE